MAYNRILVKDGNACTETFTKRVNAALKPGVLVKIALSGADIGKFVVAGATDDKERLFALSNRMGLGETIDSTYAANDTAQAYEIIPNRTLNLRSVAGSFEVGTPVTLAASGAVTSTIADDDRIIGYADEKVTTTATQPFVIVRIVQGAIG